MLTCMNITGMGKGGVGEASEATQLQHIGADDVVTAQVTGCRHAALHGSRCSAAIMHQQQHLCRMGHVELSCRCLLTRCLGHMATATAPERTYGAGGGVVARRALSCSQAPAAQNRFKLAALLALCIQSLHGARPPTSGWCPAPTQQQGGGGYALEVGPDISPVVCHRCNPGIMHCGGALLPLVLTPVAVEAQPPAHSLPQGQAPRFNLVVGAAAQAKQPQVGSAACALHARL